MEVSQTHESIPTELETRTAETLFGDTRFRPPALQMAKLIESGVTEDTILKAGELKNFKQPVMNETLAELDVILPYLHTVVDNLAKTHGDRIALYAARDAEVLSDISTITHPEMRSHLLPASGYLMLYSQGIQNPDIAKKFLQKFDLDEEHVKAGTKYSIVDGGFHGSMGERLDKCWEGLYGTSLLNSGALDIQLVSADRGAIGQQIMHFPESEEEVIDKLSLPRVDRYLGPDFSHWFSHIRVHTETYRIACAMQLMPRYHGPFSDIVAQGDDVVALPNEVQPVQNVDISDSDKGFSHNASVVNPLAAAIVQFRVIKSAMERRDSGDTPNKLSPATVNKVISMTGNPESAS